MSQYTQSVQQELHSGSHIYTNNYGATTAGTTLIASPGYHKSIFITDLIISNGATAGYFRLYENSATISYIMYSQNLAIDRSLVANFSSPMRLAPNNLLGYVADTADDYSITINYYIDDVVGFGYCSGGLATTSRVTIDEYYYASDSNSTDVGDWSEAIHGGAGQSSSVYGYQSGGDPTSGDYTNKIEKFSFSSAGNATDIGNLTVARRLAAGQSSGVSGYTSGGYTGSGSVVTDKFSFSTDGDAALVGELDTGLNGPAGQSSSVSGYTSGGYTNAGGYGDIQKFSFSSDGNSSAVGDLLAGSYIMAGQSSADHGYISAVYPPLGTQIEKFSFSSDGNSSDIGDVTVARYGASGTSSLVSGYTQGGSTGSDSSVVDRFSFSTDGNATDVGDLTLARFYTAGQQSN